MLNACHIYNNSSSNSNDSSISSHCIRTTWVTPLTSYMSVCYCVPCLIQCCQLLKAEKLYANFYWLSLRLYSVPILLLCGLTSTLYI
ncbi:uncharacterized protein BX663DRAFT_507304 [Cokeromyces recurvatus]|uniref:uncharacterized protein n=1 Tax=Cokeromyces recurvatus TaxID=90255 RepID=UPI00221F0A75|nr:uncharacterized protein BX663DRAFT_507304 [Cokeromyces recurvatus]KAI7903688.1 hypothetical protein BX663DRAFT_507304 [Cokeromyces recurvatus]